MGKQIKQSANSQWTEQLESQLDWYRTQISGSKLYITYAALYRKTDQCLNNTTNQAK